MRKINIYCLLVILLGPLLQAGTASAMTVDPTYIFSTFSLTNLSDNEQSFTVSTSLPITDSFPDSLIGGSIFAEITDTNGDGFAALSGNPVYRGLVDGVVVLDLLGFSGSSSCGGPGCSTTVFDFDGVPATVLAGDPLPVGVSLNGPAAASIIGIDLFFTLSAGDTVEFQNYFAVSAIPVPAALWLLLSGLFGFAVLARNNSGGS